MASSPKILINGKVVESDVTPFIKNNRTMVPLRVIAEYFNKKVEWNPEGIVTIRDPKKEVTEVPNYIKHLMDNENYFNLFPHPDVFDGSIELKLHNESFKYDIATIDGREYVYLPSSAEIVNNRTFVPLRFLGEVMYKDVSWDDATRTVTIVDEEPKVLNNPVKLIVNGIEAADIELADNLDATLIPVGKLIKSLHMGKYNKAIDVMQNPNLTEEERNNEFHGLFFFGYSANLIGNEYYVYYGETPVIYNLDKNLISTDGLNFVSAPYIPRYENYRMQFPLKYLEDYIYFDKCYVDENGNLVIEKEDI